MKSQELINSFWNEFSRVRGRRGRPGFTGWGHEDGVCQCQSEDLINRSNDPARMRMFLLLAVFLDQFVYTHFKDLYLSFRSEFHYPKLYGHLGGMASPSWFVYRVHGYDTQADWNQLSMLVDVLVADLTEWFRNKAPDVTQEELSALIIKEIELSFDDPSSTRFTCTLQELFGQ